MSMVQNPPKYDDVICEKPITLTPHKSVASSKASCITFDMDSLSDNISARFLVPRTFLNVVAASNRVEWLGKRQMLLYNFSLIF